MVKYSKSLVMLLGTVSVFATMPIKPVKAKGLFEDGWSFSRMSSIPRDLWNARPSIDDMKNTAWSIKESIQAKGTAYAKAKAQNFFDQQSSTIGKVATKKLHALMYRHADIHIVNDDGEHVGYVEDVNPRVGRNLIKKALGIDLDSALPGIPAFMAKAIINVIEKQAANYLEANVQNKLNAALTQLSMKALEMGLGLADVKVSAAIAKVTNPPQAPGVEVEQEIEKELKSIIPVNEVIDQEELSLMGELVIAIQANLKIKIHSWLNEVANDTATEFMSRFVKQTGEGMLRTAEVTTGVATTATVGALTGGTGAVIVGGLISGDKYVADAAPGEESYMRQALKWLSSYDTRTEEIKTKITIAATNQINANIDTFFNKVGLGSLVLTQQESDLVYGKYTSVEDEEGFINMARVEDPFSLNTFGNRIADHLQKKVTEAAEAAYQQVQETATQIGAAMQEHAEIFAETAYDFTMAFGPGLAYEESEPTELEILQNQMNDAFEVRDIDKIGELFQQTQVLKKVEEEKKPWWKIW